MPKVRTIKTCLSGASFAADLRVDSRGEFSISVPGGVGKITGDTAEAVENKWFKAAQELLERTKSTRKVIAVRYDSCLAVNNRTVFTKRDEMLRLECLIAEETSVTQGGVVTKCLNEHPDYVGFGSPRQPFPHRMVLDDGDMRFRESELLIVDWTQELEDTLVRACKGIEAVTEMLADVFQTPETLQLASSRLLSLPQPTAPKE
jgi:hypothetical protein